MRGYTVRSSSAQLSDEQLADGLRRLGYGLLFISNLAQDACRHGRHHVRQSDAVPLGDVKLGKDVALALQSCNRLTGKKWRVLRASGRVAGQTIGLDCNAEKQFSERAEIIAAGSSRGRIGRSCKSDVKVLLRSSRAKCLFSWRDSLFSAVERVRVLLQRKRFQRCIQRGELNHATGDNRKRCSVERVARGSKWLRRWPALAAREGTIFFASVFAIRKRASGC